MFLTADLHRPLDQLLRDAIDGLGEPALLLDPALRVTHVNRAAAPHFVGGAFGAEGGDSCLAPTLEGRPCSGGLHCEGCELARRLGASLETGESVGPFTLERCQLLDGRLVSRTWEAEAHPYRLDGKVGLLVTLAEAGEDAACRLAG